MSHPPGTIFVLRSGGWTSAAIRLGTRSRVNHAGIALGDGRTVEAQAKGAIIGREQDNDRVIWGDRLSIKVDWLDSIARPGGTTPTWANARIADEALKLVGTPYGFVDIAALALADLGWRQRWLERIVDRQHALICSQLVDQAYLNAGVHLFSDGRMPGRVDPGDLEQIIATGGQGVVVDPA